jgi:fibronectin type 3 domain-containing protein
VGQGTWPDDPDGTPEPLVNALRAAQAAADAAGPSPVVPGGPTLSSATAGDASVALAWTAPGSDGGAPIDSYQVWRGTTSGGEALLTTTTNPASYTDATASNGTAYYYQVAAVNSVGPGPRSNELSATPQAPPPPPPTVPGAPILDSATAGNASVALAWTAPSSDGGAAISSYQVWRGTTSGGEALLTTTANPASYTDATASNGTTYYYQVAAVNSAGPGPRSNEVSASPQSRVAVPGAPRNLVAKARRVTGVNLTWSAPLSDGGGAVIQFRIYRGTSSGNKTFLAVSTSTSYTDMATGSRVRYYYVVRAVNGAGEGPPSNESNAKTF